MLPARALPLPLASPSRAGKRSSQLPLLHINPVHPRPSQAIRIPCALPLLLRPLPLLLPLLLLPLRFRHPSSRVRFGGRANYAAYVNA